MPFPVGVPTVVVTKNYRDAEGNIPSVRVAFRPSARKVLTAQDITIEPVPVYGIPNSGTGVMSATLAATDGFTYRVSELVNGVQRVPFSISVPAGGGPYQLDELAPVEAIPETYVPVRTVEGLSPDPSGNIDLPPSAGSDPAGTAATLLGLHTADADPHTQYLLPAEANAAYASLASLGGKENVEVAAGLVTTHEGGANPHPVYLTQTEADALYATIASVTARQSRLVVRESRLLAGTVNPLPNTAPPAWAILAGFELQLPAVVGDYVEIGVNALREDSTGNSWLDQAVRVGVEATPRRYLSTGTVTPAFEGDPGWTRGGAATYAGRSSPRGFVVTENDLDSSNVRFCLAVKSNGTGILHASANYPFHWRAINYGQVD